MIPAFSTRNSTEPPLAPLTAVVTSMVTVPTFGLGIRPRGPSTLPSRPTSGIRSGGAMQRSKSIWPALIRPTPPPARHPPPRPGAREWACGPRHHATHHLVGMARIDAQIHRDLDGFVELRLGALLDDPHRLLDRIGLGAGGLPA